LSSPRVCTILRSTLGPKLNSYALKNESHWFDFRYLFLSMLAALTYLFAFSFPTFPFLQNELDPCSQSPLKDK